MGSCFSSQNAVNKRSSSKVENKQLQTLFPNWTAEESVNKSFLDEQRELFWSRCMKYGGKESIWKLLQQICEMEDNAINLEKAKSVFCNKNIKLSCGLITHAIDDQGYQYTVPLYCCSYPINMIDDVQKDEQSSQSTKEDELPDNSSNNNIELSDSKNTPLQQKNDIYVFIKGPPPPICKEGKQLAIKLRLSSNEQSTRSWDIYSKTTVSLLKAKVHHCDGYLPVQQRFFYAGKELVDNQTMEDCKMESGHMIQVILKLL